MAAPPLNTRHPSFLATLASRRGPSQHKGEPENHAQALEASPSRALTRANQTHGTPRPHHPPAPSPVAALAVAVGASQRQTVAVGPSRPTGPLGPKPSELDACYCAHVHALWPSGPSSSCSRLMSHACPRISSQPDRQPYTSPNHSSHLRPRISSARSPFICPHTACTQLSHPEHLSTPRSSGNVWTTAT
eukprot:scaffold24392_cov57-Phaeocystis_antarctica.AAC.5